MKYYHTERKLKEAISPNNINECNINQISDEKKENQFGDNLSIQYQILQTNIMRIE